MTDNLRADQIAFEALGPMANRARANQLALEVLGPYQDNLRVNQSTFEVLGIVSPATSHLRSNQLVFEVLGEMASSWRGNQVVFEILGPPLLTQAFIVTEYGSLDIDTTAEIHFESDSTGIIDSAGSLSVHNAAHWTLKNQSRCAITSYGQVVAVGASTLLIDFAVFSVTGEFDTDQGVCSFGSTSGATTTVALGNGSEPVSLVVLGTLMADDTSALSVGALPGATGPSMLTIGKMAELRLVNAALRLVGTLDIEDVAITITGFAAGDGVVSNGAILANFTSDENDGGGEYHCLFFTDRSYATTPITWSWTFGDGATSGLQNPVHVYASAGDYVVTLTIASTRGMSTMTRTITVS